MAEFDGDWMGQVNKGSFQSWFPLAAGMEAWELLAFLYQSPWQDVGTMDPELWSSPAPITAMSSPLSFQTVSDLTPESVGWKSHDD